MPAFGVSGRRDRPNPQEKRTSMKPKIPVSVVVPVKNEEANLSRCLERLADFDEVFVVDSGSDDRTCEIAREHGAVVIDFRWNGKFPKKRNWFLRNHELKHDWVLFIDADEYASEAFGEEVRQQVDATDHVGFWLTYDNHFMAKVLKHGDRFRKLALFRRSAGEYERIEEDHWSNLDMEIHEHPVLAGTVGQIHAPIDHEDFKGLHAYIRRHNEYSSWEARRYAKLMLSGADKRRHLTGKQKVKYRLLTFTMLPTLYMLYCYVWKLGFLDGRAGLVFALMKKQYFFQVRLKILEARAEAKRQAHEARARQ